MIRGDQYRITVLTSRLLRLEWSPTGDFVDTPTQVVVDRAFGPAEFTVTETDTLLEIVTEHLVLTYNKREFSPSGLSVAMRHRTHSAHRTRWNYGDELPVERDGNLGGTARTLDGVDGACPVDTGILSRYGFAVVDDSTSVEVGVDDWIAPRPPGGTDLYFFGHGLDYHAALKDFFHLTGPVPLIPRAILGNWWSRYWKYSDEEYLTLVDRYAEAGIPFSVAVIDMDWHLVDIDPRHGSGWTGYTWNTELFPEPERFLDALHERGMLVTLNLHPADGVRAHEDAYEAMAIDLGVDPATETTLAFDVTDASFVDAYLRHLHHPLEEQGVDFWWLDWQSGGLTRVEGLDPLWMLNHIHYVDSAREGKRPLTFSRYAGVGSHRYPIGFSGDTVTTWASLDFQPEFTAMAANIGYTWWSHDVGGHYGGKRDDELTTRWVQFGALSPINRLHSSADAFTSKDPTRFPAEARAIMTAFLRLRHRLVPYLYTAAWRAHHDAVAVVRPMYHDYPDHSDAYDVPNQYLLGSDVIVAPITVPRDDEAALAPVTVWVPEGTWYDLFTGQRYQGDRVLTLYRPIEEIPVLVRAGSALALLEDPLADVGANPDVLVLRVTPGSGESVVLEDDGSAAPQVPVTTAVDVREDGDAVIIRLSGDAPAREIVIDLADTIGAAETTVDGRAIVGDSELVAEDGIAPALRLRIGQIDVKQTSEIRVSGVVRATSVVDERVFAILDRARIDYALKGRILEAARTLEGIALAQRWESLPVPAALRGALLEAVSS